MSRKQVLHSKKNGHLRHLAPSKLLKKISKRHARLTVLPIPGLTGDSPDHSLPIQSVVLHKFPILVIVLENVIGDPVVGQFLKIIQGLTVIQAIFAENHHLGDQVFMQFLVGFHLGVIGGGQKLSSASAGIHSIF